MIIETSEPLIKLLAWSLTIGDRQVSTASHLTAALRLDATIPSLIIFNLYLELEGKRTAVAEIRDRCPTSHILDLGHPSLPEGDAGCDRFLPYPFDGYDIEMAVQDLLVRAA